MTGIHRSVAKSLLDLRLLSILHITVSILKILHPNLNSISDGNHVWASSKLDNQDRNHHSNLLEYQYSIMATKPIRKHFSGARADWWGLQCLFTERQVQKDTIRFSVKSWSGPVKRSGHHVTATFIERQAYPQQENENPPSVGMPNANSSPNRKNVRSGPVRTCYETNRRSIGFSRQMAPCFSRIARRASSSVLNRTILRISKSVFVCCKEPCMPPSGT